jgi:hypothetical protein
MLLNLSKAWFCNVWRGLDEAGEVREVQSFILEANVRFGPEEWDAAMPETTRVTYTPSDTFVTLDPVKLDMYRPRRRGLLLNGIARSQIVQTLVVQIMTNLRFR